MPMSRLINNSFGLELYIRREKGKMPLPVDPVLPRVVTWCDGTISVTMTK